ncbi:Methionine ABC transporter ATP-binding protein (plasmid) [Tritonibacter mobilis]|jgi:putative ABC transport system ATP-binding protein|uniref:ABC transporter ATP-binding protein n=1 Tax=Tritonibacter mobilis F1926 TaxID=1265309 RepID=A0A1B1AA96_9RHOB|nr:ABC transporter ATP-binding protein [Tritonibacter mobilis]MEE2809337.1 ABC transporter ATP-binding protein [Pseudomonadota bacterium]ANP43437.1 ABC transporter ATP-binding protein [Tritonibacter mobilis F1926]KJZ24631.1 ABC transporter ATP-binding protein [Tritonibacter mobilis]WHQ85159.1 ABC transporter ATP-binding protein [Tritonibacter mobilis]VCU62147.1 Methionine ABC transporter ATP-binding protein [Tritonibacter mobilis]
MTPVSYDIELTSVYKSYPLGKSRIPIFEDLTMTIPDGDFLAIMGPSGSGKSTILNLIGGIDTVDGGHVSIGGTMLDKMSTRALTRWRSEVIGFVFQFYNLMPMLSAAQNVELPLLLTDLSASERRERVHTILDIVGLADRHDHLPSLLSGGQQQRVGIARAIASDPRILLCDEPTGDLDRKSADEILELLQLLNTKLGKTIIMVTHDESSTRVAKRTVILDKGRFVSEEIAQCA